MDTDHATGLNPWSPLWGAYIHMWGDLVMRPARLSRKYGLHQPNCIGKPPSFVRVRGGGPSLSKRFTAPVYFDHRPEGYSEVEAFDDMSSLYEDATYPIAEPVFTDVTTLMAPYLKSDARILDPSCGAGGEARRLSLLVPDGEVVAADFSKGMVEYAHRRAEEEKITNMAFFQADVANPPAEFEGYFDMIYCEFAFHHYPDGQAAMNALHKVLAPGGKLFIADPGPEWFKRMAHELAVLADPGFVTFRSGEDYQELCQKAGFSDFYWVESLPGFGITIASA